jgi:hypothetical protein
LEGSRQKSEQRLRFLIIALIVLTLPCLGGSIVDEGVNCLELLRLWDLVAVFDHHPSDVSGRGVSHPFRQAAFRFAIDLVENPA